MRLSRIRLSLLSLCLVLHTALTLAQTKPKTPPNMDVSVEVYESTTDLRESLQKQDSLSFGNIRLPALTLKINSSRTYQQMDGFGASIADSSGWLLFNKLDNGRTSL